MIDFELTEEQQMIRDTVGAFAREEIRPAARPADETGKIPAALIAKAWQLGLVSGAIPEKFGGDGDARSAVTGAIVAEELGYGDLSIALHVLAPRLLAFPILEMGTEEQRAKVPEAIRRRRLRRRDCGADGAAIRFRSHCAASLGASATARGYVLNGAQVLRAARRRVGDDSGLCGDRRERGIRRRRRLHRSAQRAPA